MTSIALPLQQGGWGTLTLTVPRVWPTVRAPSCSRIAFGAAHVVADPLWNNVPGAPAELDWDSTLAFRRHLFSHGLGVAEAMDTAQRGMGLDWATTKELIRRSSAQALELGARIASGAGTDQLPAEVDTLAAVTAAYLEQLEVVEGAGSQAIVMASRQLAKVAVGPDDYRTVYDTVLRQVGRPVILHWLGTAFDPALHGYWGSADVDVATEHFLDLVRDHADRVDGVKVSLLDADHERALRAALPESVRLYTGDDFNYPELIKGDGEHHSDALLGIFAAIAPAAGAAPRALDDSDDAGYDAAFEPTLPLARHVFRAPTFFYKTGIAFLAWICGHQPGFTMVGGLQSARSVVDLSHTLRLADRAGLIPDPELAVRRMQALLDTVGLTDG
ncbi:MAG: dihydrodipicolinate synthase family protein [Nakamurella sp.]